MPARRALRLLRPLLPAAPARRSSTCAERGPPAPCPACPATPPPPCRADSKPLVPGRRVVCCPPPQGSRPPCEDAAPACALTCDNRLRQAAPERPARPRMLCGALRDAVAQRMRDYEEHQRREYERAVEARLARAPPAAPTPHCALPSAETIALATDGKTYTVKSDAPMPRCPASSAAEVRLCPTPQSAHPPPQPVQLNPLGDCQPKDRPRVDPCEHTPRTLLYIDRSGSRVNEQSAQACSAHASPKPVHENPKNQACDKSAASYKGITSRIMSSLRNGRGAARAKSGPGAGACKPGAARRAGDDSWCSSMPPAAATAPRCRAPTVAERLRRRPPGPCAKRDLHTSAATSSAKTATTTSEKNINAAKKLAAALSERDQLKEAGRGRQICSPKCEPPRPPPPPKPSGGALELSVPAGADTVCVRVSVGKVCAELAGACSAPPPPGSRAPPPPSKGLPRDDVVSRLCRSSATAASTPSPAEPVACPKAAGPGPVRSACSDSWLSIKSLQKKISSSRERGGPAGARPGDCVKMADVLPHTGVFVKS